jgi:glycerol-3-phosphate acyltransferase PlsY
MTTIWHYWEYFVIAYLLGSIPTAVWLGRLFFKTDVREHGSGNAGATNTLRVLGKKAGAVVFVIDVLKGILAVSLPFLILKDIPKDDHLPLMMALGIGAMIGHIFPLFARFKGGKGVATFFGIMFTALPQVAVICTLFFVLIFRRTHYVSLGSIMAAIAFAALAMMWHQHQYLSYYFWVALAPLIISYTHRSNITRLLHGNESKVYLKKRDK